MCEFTYPDAKYAENLIYFISLFAEEYTKISTPRQEVLFKKGSIGAKKRSPVAVAPATAVGTEQSDAELLHSPSSPVRLNGDADSFHYSGIFFFFSYSPAIFARPPSEITKNKTRAHLR